MNRDSECRVNPKDISKNKLSNILLKAPERYQNIDTNKISLKEFEALIPKTVPEMIKEDIALYFNYLRENRNKKSLKHWETKTGCVDSPNSYKAKNYRPIFSFLYYDRITEGFFLALLLTKIDAAFGHHKKQISIEEFNHLCRLTLIGFKPKIDSIDLKILQALSKDPTLVTQALTDEIGHSYAAVYNHLQKLKAKMGLRITTRINWAKLGVQRIFLISDNKEDFELFNEYKLYLDGQSSFLWGGTYYLQYFLLNDENRTKFVRRYESLSKEQKKTLILYELTSAPNSGYSFELYNLEEQKWDFDFATTFLKSKPQELKQRTLEERTLFIDKFPPKEVYQLTEIEEKIAEGLVGNYDLPQKEIADILGIHAPNLSVIKTKLQKDGIISPQLMIRTFLPLYCLLWVSSTDKDIIEILVYLMHRIPFSNISPVYSHNNPEKLQLICYLQLDDILYYSLVTFLMDLLKENSLDDFRLGLLSDYYFGMAKINDILNK